MSRNAVRYATFLLLLAVLVPPAAWAQPPLLESVKAFLDTEAWRYESVPNDDALRMRYRGQSETWVVLVQAREDLRQLSLYSIVPAEIPADRVDAVGEYLHRANYGLALGCFEFDYDARQVRFRTAVDVEDAELSPAQVRNYLYMNVLTCDRYLSGLTQVIEGQAAPRAAVAAVESTMLEEREGAMPKEEPEGAPSVPAAESDAPSGGNPESAPRTGNQ